ncbi:rhomboid family intramembrane serine protease [Flavipsychrobacter stenotrophus]|uniref:rhomboid family intramembrane serine protease n=1 Tax=Flavipsychrobacter stenotrophus TaxID=2077091 RepID=UPI00196A882D|nr:rhomboid family intramembrane serine protease [Flavipsychrobacter stenotrophus]
MKHNTFVDKYNLPIVVFTLIIIVTTVLVSLAAFNDANLRSRLILYPRIMNGPSEYYRLLTSGFIHADWNHLIFNMITMFFFGRIVEESILGDFYGRAGGLIYLILYMSGIVMSSVPSVIKHRNDSTYAALGASGGVSSILFFVIYFFPWSKISMYFIPIGIPAIIYGVLYTLYSLYMSKRGNDNIGHDAHLGGALYGFVFALIVDPTHGQMFLYQILHPVF